MFILINISLILLPVFYALSGFFMKISDDANDRRDNTILGVSAAVICGVCIGYLAVNNSDAAVIFLSILIGTVVAWKVDCLNHMLSLIIFLGIMLIIGFPSIGIITLIFCALAAFLDEIGNDSAWAARSNLLYNFFQYRFALKIMILIFVAISFIPGLKVPGLQFLGFYSFICFLLFELSYEIVGLKFDSIYEIIRQKFNPQKKWQG